MRLHEFVASEQTRILRCAVTKLKRLSPDVDERELEEGLAPVIDEIKRALQRDAGIAVESPLPGHSEAAAQVGERGLGNGFRLPEVVRAIGMISDAIGHLGAERRLAFDAHDYQIFNQCIDTSTAAAIDRYDAGSSARRDREATARLGALAHELRNALASATMAFDVLREGKMGISSRIGDVLQRSLSRMGALVSQTLLAVRLEAGKRDSQLIDVDRLLHDLAAEAVPERGVTISVAVRGTPRLHCDEGFIASALGNILQNALKFTSPGGHIEMRAHEAEDGVEIEIADGCGGLPEGVEAQMFAPFAQNHSDRRGLGLGLAITRDAVAACKGDVQVRNRPNHGCVFVLRFPSA